MNNLVYMGNRAFETGHDSINQSFAYTFYGDRASCPGHELVVRFRNMDVLYV